MRPTSARVCVLQVLQANASASYFAEQIFHELSDMGISVSLGTIYRVLQELEQAGLALREWQSGDAPGKSRFSVAPEVRPPATYTLVCRHCGRDIVLADKSFSESLHRLGRALAFDLHLNTPALQATCNACAGKQESH